jgi:putative tryptophan/tyrosine transport system substrate-binding protein
MRRREFIALMGASVAWPLAAVAQQSRRTYRFGCLLASPRDGPLAIAFLDELRRRGFIEGQNLTLEYRAYGLHSDLISEYAAELVTARVDVIATSGDVAVRAVQQATKTVPIVAIAPDMLGSGLVTSLARPEGNTTGVNSQPEELDGKRQEILIEAVPGLRRMAVLAHIDHNGAKLDVLQAAARAHNVELSIYRVANPEEIAAAIDNAQASGAAALNILASPLFYGIRRQIMGRVAAAHLPTIYEFPETAEEGGFAAYGPRLVQLFQEVMAQQIVHLFSGSKVVDIPVEQATKFELVINLKTANAMGVTVPATLVARADKVIE